MFFLGHLIFYYLNCRLEGSRIIVEEFLIILQIRYDIIAFRRQIWKE